jgi:tetratricopeptide (TPR) repeat protein
MAEENGLHTGEVDPEVAEAAVAEAQTLGEEDRWDEAHSLLLVTLEEQGESALLLCWAGIASQRLGNESEAYDFFRRALALQPEDPFILAAAGSGVAIFDDPDAESALRMAALTSPDFPFARAAYGAYLAREGLFAEAVGELEAARALAPEDAEVHADLGMAYLLAGRADDGIASLEEALALRADDAWLRGVYGLALVEARRTEEGAEQLHRAAAERVEDVELQLLSALSAAGEGWQDEAWNALARAQAAADASDHEMIQEVEDALEGGDEDAVTLRDDLGPSLLRERLVQRA